jgi:hypothetical protein
MILLAAADTLAGVAQTAAKVTCTIFGMELNGTTETYKVLDQRQLASAVATIYTVPGSTTTFVRSIMVVNNDTNTQTFQLFRGGTAAANAITPVMTIPAGGMAVYEDGAGWTVFNNLGQAMTSTTAGMISAILTADTANQTSTTEAVVSPVLTVPANYLTGGSTIDFQLGFSAAQGAVANTTPGILFQLRWGGLAGTVIASVGTITPATLLAALAGYLRGFVTFRTIGATGKAQASMMVTDPRGTRVAAGDMASKVGMSAAGGVTIDTTAAKDLVITCKTTVADAAAITFGTGGLSVLERA